jgi:ribokinase
MKENKIAVIGLSGESIFMKMDHFNNEGETVFADTYNIEYGGKGYNQAVAAKRFGSDVSFLTVCGDDEIAKKVKISLDKEGINSKLIIKENQKSASACILIDKKGHNRVIVYPGVSSQMTKEDVYSFEDEIKSSKYLLLQLETTDEALIAAIEIANKHNTLVILNPAPAKQLPENLLNSVYLLTPNEQEASVLFDGKDVSNLNYENVIITKGEDGVVLKEKNNIYNFPAMKVTPLNTTGAGDTYNGILASSLLNGYSMVESAKIASVGASLSVTKEFVIDSIPYKEQVLDAYNTYLSKKE